LTNTVTFLPNEINYINILNDQYYSVGLFFIPKGFNIPLHDHKNLLVLSRCLLGRLEIVSYDKVDINDKTVQFFEARLTGKKILKQGDINILTPYYKNYHQIKALEDSILLDIIIPDYGKEECKYYKVYKSYQKIYLTLLSS
jgi:hypothetical protein